MGRYNLVGILIALGLLCCTGMACAANPHLVRDINTHPVNTGSDPANLYDVNGALFFISKTAESGAELWKSDGTAPGTVLVKDICPGSCDSSPSALTNVNGTLYFFANDGQHGWELWKSDGSANGTLLVKEIVPGPSGVVPARQAAAHGWLYFILSNPDSTADLWRSDGTDSGTIFVTRINDYPYNSYSPNLASVNDTLFFSTCDSSYNNSLWKIAQGGAVPELLLEIPNFEFMQEISDFTHVNGVLYFAANNATQGMELWKSDGTPGGTTIVKDIIAGASGSYPLNLTTVNGTLFFTAKTDMALRELWKSDGTLNGTVRVWTPPGGAFSYINSPTAVNDTLFFAYNDYVHADELWKSDGTEAGTVLVKDIHPDGSSSPTNFLSYNGTLFFSASDGSAYTALWRSDGTAAGTFMVKDILEGRPGSGPLYPAVSNGALFFSADDGIHGRELWKSHGSAADTLMLKDINSSTTLSAAPAKLTAVNNTLYFTATDGSSPGTQLWKSDGTLFGTNLIKDINPNGYTSQADNLTESAGRLFFTADDSISGSELWTSDGTPAGTGMVKDILPGPGSASIYYLTDVNGTLFFVADDGSTGTELWKSDGTPAGTGLVKDIGTGTIIINDIEYPFSSSNPAGLTNLNGLLIFSAEDNTHGRELWRSDGTPAGTTLIRDICGGGSSSNPGSLAGIADTIYFTSSDCQSGSALWKSDGTPAGTVLVKSFSNLPQPPTNLTNVNGTLFFAVANGPTVHELWKSDGSEAGTELVLDTCPGKSASQDAAPHNFVTVNGILFFTGWDDVYGRQIWRSDGTAAGTERVTTFPGINPYFPWNLVSGNGTLYFKGPEYAGRLWKSDGSPSGTGPAYADAYPQNVSSIISMGNMIFFAGDDATRGTELFALTTGLSINANTEFTRSQTVSLTLACPFSAGCSQMWLSNTCLFDSGAWEPFSPSKEWLLSPGDARKNLCVKFMGNSGGESAVYTNSSLTLDTTLPETRFDAIVPTTSPTPVKSSQFSFSSNEPGVTFQCWLDFEPAGFQPCSSPVSHDLFQGSHTFRVRAIDPAGNVDDSPATHEWTIIDDLGGSAFAWGNNDYGQLGIGAADYNAHPLISAIAGPVGFIQIDGGYRHTAALRNDGTVWAWGNNDYSQLGRAGGNSYNPVQVPGLSDIIALDAGTNCTTALHRNGTVWEWGSCGNSVVPTASQVLGIDQVTAVSTGDHHSLALRQDGTVWGWGQDLYGELGQGKTGFIQLYPTIVPALNGISSISAGTNHSLAIRGSDGRVLAWGWNGFGQLGSGDALTRTSPTAIDQANGAFSATRISAGPYSSLAVDSNGNYWSWGMNIFGNLGLELGPLRYTPTAGTIPGEQIIDVAGGYANSVFLTASGTTWTVGSNWSGQIGRGLYDNDYHWVPEKVAYLSGATSVAAAAGSGSQLFALRSTWITATVDANSVYGYTSLAVDTNNTVHISYVNQAYTLGYLTNSGGSWQKTVVPMPVGVTRISTTASATDANNASHICAMTEQSGGWGVHYFTNRSGSWQSLYIDGGPLSANQECDIAVAPDNTVLIGYFGINETNTCGGLRLATIAPDGVLTGIAYVDDGCPTGSKIGRYPSLAIDSNNTVHISYINDSQAALKYVSGPLNPLNFAPPVTVYDYTGSTIVQWSSLALLDGKPAISYTAQTAAGFGTLFSVHFARFDGSQWLASAVDASGKAGMYGTSLVYVGSTPTVSYYDGANEDLKVAYHTGSRWAYAAVDTEGKVGQFSSLAVDTSGSLHVSYWDDTASPPRQQLKYATNVDAVKPEGFLQISNASTFTKNPAVALSLTCSDGFGIGCWQVALSSDSTFTIEQAAPFAPTIQYQLPDGDGPKSIFARYRDAANNWSGTSQVDVFLDTQRPLGTLAIIANNGFSASRLTPLVTSCVDNGGAQASGCIQMKFSSDGTTYAAALPYSSESSIFLPAGDGLKEVHAIYIDRAGNESDPVQATVRLDSTPPVTTATPVGGQKSTPQSVVLSCSDTDGSGCAGSWYSLDGSPPGILYTAPIAISQAATLSYFSRDALGNQEATKTETYSFIQGATQLTLELSRPTVENNGSVMAWGRLQNNSGNNADPSGATITLTITDPKGVAVTPALTTTIYDNLGNFIFNNVSGFDQKGLYTLRAAFDGSSLLAPSASVTQPLLVGASAGYAVLIEGRIVGQEGLDSHNKTANRIYKKLQARGFADDNIYYFNYQNQPGVDATPSLAQIKYSIEEWARERMNGLPAPLYVIMVDHGDPDAFYINTETITPTLLDSWLTTLEGGLTDEALLEKRVVIIGSCYSGTFINQLSRKPEPNPELPQRPDAGRVIITSAAPGEVSYKGPMESDTIRSGEYFLEELFTQLERGETIRQAFIDAADKTRTYTQKGGGSANSNAPYFDGAVQHPLLDDNGDHIGSNTLTDGELVDGSTLAAMQLGIGATYNVNSAQFPVDLLQVNATVFLDAQTSALLWAKVTDDDQVDSAVWIEIRKPDLILATPTGNGPTEQADLNTTRIPLLHQNGRWEIDPASVGFPFDQSGTYTIFYFVRDKDTLKLAPMKQSKVYRAKDTNHPPGTFQLLAPVNASEQATIALFSWTPAADQDLDPVTYTLQISQDPGFSSVDYRLENISESMAAIGSEAGLIDHKTYYWNVLAIDSYGAVSQSSATWSFTTNNPNSLPARIKGYVFNNQGSPVSEATVAAKDGNGTIITSGTTIPGGAFILLVTPGSYFLSTTAAGYAPPAEIPVSLGSGDVLSLTPLYLVPSNPTLQVTLLGDGSGSLHGTLSCSSGTCSSTLASGTPVTLTATAEWNALFAGWSGSYCSGSMLTDCSFTLTTASSITATFTPNYQARNGGNYYSSLQTALNTAGNGATVEAMEYDFLEPILFNRSDISVTLDGGRGPGYSAAVGGYSTVSGSFRIQQGTIKIMGPLAVR